MRNNRSLFTLTLLFCLIIFTEIACLPSFFQDSPSLLPEQIPIQKAKVDPAFSTTKMSTIGFLPFSNAVQYDDAYVLYSNLIDKFNNKHPQYNLIPPEEVMSKISSSGLSDDFNVFLGDYSNTGVANPSFLRKIKRVLQVDSVLFGEILGMGPYSYRKKYVSAITGKVRFTTVNQNVLGIRLACYRGKDGRKIWEGEHTLLKKEGLAALADSISTIFANYFGRRGEY